MQGKMPGGYRKVIAIEQDFLPPIIRLVVRLFAYVKGCGRFHKKRGVLHEKYQFAPCVILTFAPNQSKIIYRK